MTNQNKRKSNVLGSTFRTNFEKSSSQTVFFNTCFDKNHLKTLIAWFLEQYGEKVTVDLVETLKQVGFHQATRAGVSLGIDDLKIPFQKNTLLSQASLKLNQVTNQIQAGNLTSVEKSQRLIDTWNQTSETLRQTAVHNFRTTNPVNPVYMMAFSGARGNISQVRQLVAMRGLMADPQGAILEFPIQSNFREGLTVTEYLISCYGARKGLVDTALRTATSGYLTRRLVDAVQHVVVHVTDCQTRKGVLLKGKNLEQRLIGRVLLEDINVNNKTLKKNTLISPGFAKHIALKYKEILVRSPLTCQTEKSVCQLCYGLDLSQGKLVSIGEAVGIIAAQSIGEPGTQLTMRTFHTGGVGVFSEQAMKSFTAPFEGKVEFLEPLSGLFVRTPHGNIVYLLKHKTISQNKPFLRLTSSQPMHQPNIYQIMHHDVPAGSLLWVKQGEYVKSGQLLLQASRLQTTTQEMPESSHPVRAPISGEVFFQSMSIRVVEEEKRLVSKTKKKKQNFSKPGVSPKTESFGKGTSISQMNQKEISPKFPTLIELGNFWIFATFIQKEEKICDSFFLNGDLVSSETPIQQYNLHLVHTGQLKKLNSSVVFGQNSFNFLFSNIHYSGGFYFLKHSNPTNVKPGTSFLPSKTTLEKEKSNSNLLIYTTNSKYTLLTWYPFFQKNSINSLGYCVVLSFDREFHGLKNSELGEISKGVISKKQNFSKSSDLNYLWSPHQVFRLKTTQKKLSLFKKVCQLDQNKLIRSSDFLVSHTSNNFSKIGIFQIDSNKKINWNLQTHSENNFVKNGHRKAIQTYPKNSVFGAGEIKKQRQGCSNNLVFQKTNPYQRDTKDLNEITRQFKSQSEFLQHGLKVSHKNLCSKSYVKVIQKRQVWAYIPENGMKETCFSQLSGIVLQPGKKFETLRFDNSYVSTNFIQSKNVLFLKSKTNPTLSFYSVHDLVNSKKEFQSSFSFSKNWALAKNQDDFKKKELTVNCKYSLHSNWEKPPQIRYFGQQISKTFCFYKDYGSFKVKKVHFNIKRYECLSHVLIFQKNYHQFISTSKFSNQNTFFHIKEKDSSAISLNSPLFTKQSKTIAEPKTSFGRDWKTQFKPSLKMISPTFSGWLSLSSFFKIEMIFNTSTFSNKRDTLKQSLVLPNINSYSKGKNQRFKKGNNSYIAGSSLGSFIKDFSKISNNLEKIDKEKQKLQLRNSETLLFPGLSLFVYQGIKLQNSNQFQFLTFSNGCILPEWAITEAFLTSKKLGEFRGAQNKQKQTAFSVLQTQHRTSFVLPNEYSTNLVTKLEVGSQIRWGQEVSEGFAIPVSGQIIKTTTKAITLRKGIPLLASIRGLVHILHKDLIEKNDLLITLRSRRLQTEDIVQGIPKIEQLFEARETQGGEIIQNNMHTLLHNFFIRARQVRPFDEAVDLSLTYIQKFLVENILEAYSNQGVTIAEKHVEVVVRQMTARVRITHSGDTGFLPGEFVQLRWIEKINMILAKLGRRQAQYEPIILGITKSVLQSESFLVAASFQQVSKVLVRSALAKKTDFLRGLHENILVGQPIPAGTGIVTLATSTEKLQDSLDT